MTLPGICSFIVGAFFVAFALVANAQGDFLYMSCPAGSYDMTSYVRSGVGITSDIILESKSPSLRECARFCIARSSCLSFTYHTKTTVCGLSNHTMDNGITTKGQDLIYSEYQWLPSEVTFIPLVDDITQSFLFVFVCVTSRTLGR